MKKEIDYKKRAEYLAKDNIKLMDNNSSLKSENKELKEQLILSGVSQQSELLKVLGKHIAEQYDLDCNGVIEQLEWKAKNL